MNDVHIHELEQNIRDQAKDAVKNNKWEQRADRRAAALNAITLARTHAGRQGEPYTQNEADVIVAIMELLDRVAGS